MNEQNASVHLILKSLASDLKTGTGKRARREPWGSIPADPLHSQESFDLLRTWACLSKDRCRSRCRSEWNPAHGEWILELLRWRKVPLLDPFDWPVSPVSSYPREAGSGSARVLFLFANLVSCLPIVLALLAASSSYRSILTVILIALRERVSCARPGGRVDFDLSISLPSRS